MSASEVRSVIERVLSKNPKGLRNYVLRGKSLGDAVLTGFDLIDSMAADVISDVVHATEQMASRQILAYDPSYQTSASQVLAEAILDVPELALIDEAIRNDDVPSDTGGEPVIAMVHCVGTADEQIAAFRLKGPGIAARRVRGVPLVPKEGIFKPLAGDILYYEPRFDVITISDFVLFNTVTLVQTKLHAPEKAQKLARETLESVTSRIKIDGYNMLQAAVVEDPTLRAKMAYVARLIENDPDYAKNLTTSKLVGFVQDHPEYGIALTTFKGEKRLKFETSPQHRHKIPRLLADDYLHSYLTDRSYEAGSKQDVR